MQDANVGQLIYAAPRICKGCKIEVRCVFVSRLTATLNQAVVVTPKRLKHCAAGQILAREVIKVVSFEERRAGKWQDATPVLFE